MVLPQHELIPKDSMIHSYVTKSQLPPVPGPRGPGVLFTSNRHFHFRLTGRPVRSLAEDLPVDLSDLILAAPSDLSVAFESTEL